MNNNYNSKNNNDKSINNNDTDSNNITSFILVNKAEMENSALGTHQTLFSKQECSMELAQTVFQYLLHSICNNLFFSAFFPMFIDFCSQRL